MVVRLVLERDHAACGPEREVLTTDAHRKERKRSDSEGVVYRHWGGAMRERWGTFAVRDHISAAPFVTDVLIYDRLIIPVPDPADPHAHSDWNLRGWEPEGLQECLNILKVKTEKADGLALKVPWDKSKQERFKNRMSAASALATQKRNAEQGYYMDPFQMTRELLKDEFRPALPAGVSKAWTVAAYASSEAFRLDLAGPDPARRARLALKLSHHFLAPKGADPRHEMLKRAVGLATTDDFRRKRERFYQWQEEIIQEEISDDKAIEELVQRLSEYNKATEAAFSDTCVKYVFTVIPIGFAIAGALLNASKPKIILAGATGLVELTRFWKFDRKPTIEAGDLDSAAMIHDVQKALSLD
jgi:hypothetical protein